MKQSIGIIGVGAFGEFMLKHIAPYFETRIFDAKRDLSAIAATYNVKQAELPEICTADIVVIAVPVQEIAKVAAEIAPYLKAGQLVMDVASVKCLPIDILTKTLPPQVDMVSVHPLFGPQSGRYGIHGQNIAVVEVRGGRGACVADFLKNRLDLNVITTTAEAHDVQMAYVQGLTHMIARVFQRIEMPEIVQSTRTFNLLQDMVNIVKDDSDELFYAIQRDNPYVETTKRAFFDAVKQLEDVLHEKLKS